MSYSFSGALDSLCSPGQIFVPYDTATGSGGCQDVATSSGVDASAASTAAAAAASCAAAGLTWNGSACIDMTGTGTRVPDPDVDNGTGVRTLDPVTVSGQSSQSNASSSSVVTSSLSTPLIAAIAAGVLGLAFWALK